MWEPELHISFFFVSTHTFILYFPPNSIFFVILLVLYHGLRKVASVPNSWTPHL